MNSPRQPGTDGEGEEEARDGQTPLHLAASWGLEETVQCLLEFGANVNAQVYSFTFLGVGGMNLEELSLVARDLIHSLVLDFCFTTSHVLI